MHKIVNERSIADSDLGLILHSLHSHLSNQMKNQLDKTAIIQSIQYNIIIDKSVKYSIYGYACNTSAILNAL